MLLLLAEWMVVGGILVAIQTLLLIGEVQFKYYLTTSSISVNKAVNTWNGSCKRESKIDVREEM
jgi:hypothetical protein